VQNWKQLSKFKLSALVVASSAAGFVAGSDEHVDWSKLAWTALGTMGAAASANTLNQVWRTGEPSGWARVLDVLPGSLAAEHAVVWGSFKTLCTGCGPVAPVH
jgi:heme o synthase